MKKEFKKINWKGSIGDTVQFTNQNKLIIVKVKSIDGAEFGFTISKNKFKEFLK